MSNSQDSTQSQSSQLTLNTRFQISWDEETIVVQQLGNSMKSAAHPHDNRFITSEVWTFAFAHRSGVHLVEEFPNSCSSPEPLQEFITRHTKSISGWCWVISHPSHSTFVKQQWKDGAVVPGMVFLQSPKISTLKRFASPPGDESPKEQEWITKLCRKSTEFEVIEAKRDRKRGILDKSIILIRDSAKGEAIQTKKHRKSEILDQPIMFHIPKINNY